MHLLAEILRDLLIFIGAMIVLLVALVLIVSNLPEQNPLKRILSALSMRVGATLLAGVFALPIEPIPGLDVAYDIGVPLALAWFWYTFFRDTYHGRPQTRDLKWAAGPTIEHEP
jgi:uncharacterized protein YggT (Ycf19 family)